MGKHMTDDDIMTSTIARGVHLWMYNMKNLPFTSGLGREQTIEEIVKECLAEAKRKINKRNHPTLWEAHFMYDEGYKMQVGALAVIEAETREEALEIVNNRISILLEKNPTVEIFDIKIKKLLEKID